MVLKKGCQMLGAALLIAIILPGWLGSAAYLVLSLYGWWLLRGEGKAFQAGAVLGILYAVLNTAVLARGWENSYSAAYVLMVLFSCSMICVAWGVSKKVTGKLRYGFWALAAGFVLRVPLLAFVLRLLAMNIRVDSFWGQVRSLSPAGFSLFSLLLHAAMGICLWRVQAEKTASMPISPIV